MAELGPIVAPVAAPLHYQSRLLGRWMGYQARRLAAELAAGRRGLGQLALGHLAGDLEAQSAPSGLFRGLAARSSGSGHVQINTLTNR